MTGGQFIFLVCSERSGSNLITSVLNGHPAITAPPPSHLFRLFALNMQNYAGLENDANWRVAIQDIVDAFEHQLGSWNTKPSVDHLLEKVENRTIFDPIVQVYLDEMINDSSRLVFVKENHTARFSDILLKEMPGCRFIFMVRDPRDVAASYLKTDGIAGGVARAVDVWHKDQVENLAFLDRCPNAQIHSLRYEDLIADPTNTLSEITTFLDLDFDEAMLDFHQNARTKRNAQRIAAWTNTSRPILAQNAGKYRDVLNAAEVEYIELRCADIMAQFDYSCDIVKSPMDQSIANSRCDELLAQVRAGGYKIESEEEQIVRKRRLEMIEVVKNRRLR